MCGARAGGRRGHDKTYIVIWGRERVSHRRTSLTVTLDELLGYRYIGRAMQTTQAGSCEDFLVTSICAHVLANPGADKGALPIIQMKCSLSAYQYNIGTHSFHVSILINHEIFIEEWYAA